MGLDMYLYAERGLPEDFGLTDEERAEFLRDGEAYVSGYDHHPAQMRGRYRELVRAAGLEAQADPETPHALIVPNGLRVCVAYWRKANQVHSWFVRECQDGVDECQYSEPIPRDKLLSLRNICAEILGRTRVEPGTINEGMSYTPEEGEWRPVQRFGLVIANPELAQEHLPTQEGFFFGSTDYDEGYVWQLDRTMDQIDRALTAPEGTLFRYHSSW